MPTPVTFLRSALNLPAGVIDDPAELGFTAFTTNQASTATTEATATAVVTAPAITFDGTTPIIIEFAAPSFQCSVTTSDCNLTLYDGASPIGVIFSGRAPVVSVGADSITAKAKITPSAAAHTYSIRAWVSAAATFTVVAGVGGAGAFLGGYIRITTGF